MRWKKHPILTLSVNESTRAFRFSSYHENKKQFRFIHLHSHISLFLSPRINDKRISFFLYVNRTPDLLQFLRRYQGRKVSSVCCCMTSASELFNNRRYRLGRNPIELEAIDSSSSVDRFSHHNRRHNYHNSRRHRHDLDGCDPLRRTANQINRPSFPERESVRLDQGSGSGGSQSITGNANVENFTRTLGSERFSRSDRLPGAVLLARERLLERLRGVSSLGHRQSSRASSGIPEDDLTLHDNIRDSEGSHSSAGVNPSTSSYALIDPYLALQETRNRPPGLTQDALDRLHVEVFTNAEKGNDGAISRASKECSICLESFLEGAELICLPCGHRYHSCCLNPWVRICGDCPYCRAGIIVTNCRAVK